MCRAGPLRPAGQAGSTGFQPVLRNSPRPPPRPLRNLRHPDRLLPPLARPRNVQREGLKLIIIHVQNPAIVSEEHGTCQQTCPLVPIHEYVPANDPANEGGSLVKDIWIKINPAETLARLIHCCFKQPVVSYAWLKGLTEPFCLCCNAQVQSPHLISREIPHPRVSVPQAASSPPGAPPATGQPSVPGSGFVSCRALSLRPQCGSQRPSSSPLLSSSLASPSCVSAVFYALRAERATVSTAHLSNANSYAQGGSAKARRAHAAA